MVIIDFIDFILKTRLTFVVLIKGSFESCPYFFGNFHIVQSFAKPIR